MIITNAGPCYLCDAETESALPSGIRVCAPCERREFPVRVRAVVTARAEYSEEPIVFMPIDPIDFDINLGWSPRAG